MEEGYKCKFELLMKCIGIDTETINIDFADAEFVSLKCIYALDSGPRMTCWKVSNWKQILFRE